MTESSCFDAVLTLPTVLPYDYIVPELAQQSHVGFTVISRVSTGLSLPFTQLAYHFNWRTAKPLGPSSAPGCDEPTSRCQTSSSMWTLRGDQPVIPGVPFIRLAMALPFRTTGSLSPAFAPARPVCLAVKPSSIFTLYRRFLFVMRRPLNASVTFWEATTPVKLPTRQCSLSGLRKFRVRFFNE